MLSQSLYAIYLFLAIEDLLDSYVPAMKLAKFANSIDLDEVAHNEPPHLYLHCLPSSL